MTVHCTTLYKVASKAAFVMMLRWKFEFESFLKRFKILASHLDSTSTWNLRRDMGTKSLYTFKSKAYAESKLKMALKTASD